MTAPPEELAVEFDLDTIDIAYEELEGPRYNVAPSQNVAGIRVLRGDDETEKRVLGPLRWGLIPFWAGDTSIGNRMINARAETAAEKPAYRKAIRTRRCLIPASGFYEWQKPAGSKQKQPWFIRLRDGRPFAFAGLWERWGSPDTGEGVIESCTILTTAANARVQPIHDRMPVIVGRDDRALWLDRGVIEPEAVAHVLRPYDADKMEAWPVSQRVNSPAHDDAECIEPLQNAPGDMFS